MEHFLNDGFYLENALVEKHMQTGSSLLPLSRSQPILKKLKHDESMV